ncbi:HNH endonuclease [Aquibacillus saliphilus]|uniref:HNH endonuclease n=1 Tax=Aquibacillus saliphilus TaxID=1909422 RepID=UPI001CF0B742|nr:HNH endonuclease [Aquibacillus saliphilus]
MNSRKVERKVKNNVEFKKCTNCTEWKENNLDNFYKNKGSKDGLTTWCKKCMIKNSKKYNEENREWYINWKRDYHEENKESENIRRKKWYRDNKEKQQEYFTEWQYKNKDKIKEYQLYRSANKKHEITKDEWISCLNYFNHCCAYCGISEEESLSLYNQRLHQEHVDHNGANDLSNNIPSCKGCNSGKNTKDLDEFIFDYAIEQEKIDIVYKWINEDYKKHINQL